MDDIKIFRIGVGVIVKKDGLVLLGKRKNSYGDGTWSFPGGHLEFGERIEDCAIREVSEEAGISIKNLKRETFMDDVSKSEGQHYVTLFVSADFDKGESRILEPDKCEEWKWFELDQLPEPLFLPVANLIKHGIAMHARDIIYE